jgi:D-alanyl-D-alanine carboxypeptidase-like protein
MRGAAPTRTARLAVALAAVALLAACGPGGGGVRGRAPADPAVVGSLTSPVSPSLAADVVAPAFVERIRPIDTATRASMGDSWRPGCPVAIADLRLLDLSFWGFDNQPHPGQLIVNRRVAANVVSVFRTLYRARFPIRKMEIVHAYVGPNYTGRTDQPSDDDTAGFNCRNVPGAPGVWSQHAYGLAVDINPVENPYVAASGQVVPKEGRSFADRARRRAGTILRHGVVVRAFASIGWGWGGNWHSFQDFMHFSSTGR